MSNKAQAIMPLARSPRFSSAHSLEDGTVPRGPLSEALVLMTRALALLDVGDAPAQVGAYLDLSIAYLRKAMA